MFGLYLRIVYLCTTKLTNISNMAKKINEKEPVMTQIKAMEVGDELSIPIGFRGVQSVRSNLYLISLEMERKYTSHLNRAAKCLEITRHK